MLTKDEIARGLDTSAGSRCAAFAESEATQRRY